MGAFLIAAGDCDFEKIEKGGAPDFLWGIKNSQECHLLL
jgi:hypothetical protein